MPDLIEYPPMPSGQASARSMFVGIRQVRRLKLTPSLARLSRSTQTVKSSFTYWGMWYRYHGLGRRPLELELLADPVESSSDGVWESTDDSSEEVGGGLSGFLLKSRIKLVTYVRIR